MEPERLPALEKEEYDALIEEKFLCRIAFNGERHPKVAPFLYVFDGSHMYFLASRYGSKVDYFERDPRVCVEVEDNSEDLSDFGFVALYGELEEVEDPDEGREVRRMFVDLIEGEELSEQVLSAFGHSPEEPVDSIMESDRFMTWRLVGVERIVGLGD